MAYRDDHDAALLRIAALEQELEATKRKLDANSPADGDADADAPAVAAAGAPPATAIPPGPQRVAGVHIDRTGGVLRLSWSGWGAGNFISTMLLYPLPGFAVLVAGAWLSLGAPRTTPYNLSWPWFIPILVLTIWNTAALVANRGNRITVTAESLDARQGRVPWLVAYRRRRIARGEIRGVEVTRDWDPESELTRYKVVVSGGGGRTAVTGALFSEEQARAIASTLASSFGVTAG